MRGRWEKTYGFLFKSVLVAVNPFKSAFTQPQCILHQFINWRALSILKNDKYEDAYNFFSDYIVQLNEGVVWADQDMKSSGHFYHPEKERGLYGNNDALSLAVNYYTKALENWDEGNVEKSLFYLGACVHLVQDVTVPQHANNRLLDDHRKFEHFIRGIYLHTPDFWAHHGLYHVETIEEVIKCNARVAVRVYAKFRHMEDEKRRFYIMTKFLMPLAQKTTAGCFLKFYKEAGKSKERALLHRKFT